MSKHRTALIPALAFCLVGLSACNTTHHHVAEIAPANRLSLLPQGSIAQNKTTSVDVKLNNIKTRDLLTKDDLAQPLQLFAVDSTLTDFQFITPQPTNLRGIYNFSFTPHTSAGYRVWADVKPTYPMPKAAEEEFPQADLGAHRPGAITKTQKLETATAAGNAVLSFDKAPTDDSDVIGTIRIAGAGHKTVEANGQVIGIYDDFHHVFSVPLNKGSFHLEARHAGFIKLFARLKTANNTIVTVPFGVIVKKAPQD